MICRTRGRWLALPINEPGAETDQQKPWHDAPHNGFPSNPMLLHKLGRNFALYNRRPLGKIGFCLRRNQEEP